MYITCMSPVLLFSNTYVAHMAEVEPDKGAYYYYYHYHHHYYTYKQIFWVVIIEQYEYRLLYCRKDRDTYI